MFSLQEHNNGNVAVTTLFWLERESPTMGAFPLGQSPQTSRPLRLVEFLNELRGSFQ